MYLSRIRASLNSVTVALIFLLTAAGCGGGGGGGGGGGSSSPNPVIAKLAFTTPENAALPVQLTATDPGGGSVAFAQSGNPTSGTVTGFTAAGAFVYKPNASFVGMDSFTVTATDSGGHMTTGTISVTVTLDHPPVASNTIQRADGAALASINVLANASDPDNDPLTVTITGTPLVGNASVNSDGSVSITGLPSDFKGLTRFTYQVTDPSGESATATAAIFVGADPFRTTFVGDAAGNGSYEVYLTDFAADPQVMSAATQGNLRLKGFAVSGNGATVVYRTQDTTNAATTSLSFMQTATATTQVSIPLPSGVAPVLNSSGKDQFVVSPDGQWIALIAGQGSTSSVYVLNVATPTVVSQVNPAGAVYATQPTFSPDSKNIYFLATSVPGGASRSLYFAALSSPGATALVSAASDPASNDDVSAYSVSQDQARIVEQANRGGRVGLYFIDPTKLQTEIQVSHTFASGEALTTSTINLRPGSGGSADDKLIAYSTEIYTGGVGSPSTSTAYIASISATPAPRLVASAGAVVIGIRPDDGALLYTKGSQVFEATVAAGTPDVAVGGGSDGWYDSTGNIVLLEQALPSGGTPPYYPALASTVRGSFDTTQPVGSGSMAAQYVNVTGFDRAVALIGQGPITGTAATTAQLALVNALAPSDLFYLASFQSPLQLTSDIATVVTD